MTVTQLSSVAPRSVASGRPRVAVIGAGYWGKNIVRNFASLNALAAVVDQDRSTSARARVRNTAATLRASRRC